MTESKKQYFLIIPEELFIDSLSNDDRIIFGVILLFTRLKGFCWASNETLAQEAKVSPSTVKRSIARLKKENFIETELTPKKGAKHFAWERKIIITFNSISDDTQAVNNLLITQPREVQSEPFLSQERFRKVPREVQIDPIYNNTINNIKSTHSIKEKVEPVNNFHKYFNLESETEKKFFSLKKYPKIYLKLEELEQVLALFQQYKLTKEEQMLIWTRCQKIMEMKNEDFDIKAGNSFKYLTGFLLRDALKLKKLKS